MEDLKTRHQKVSILIDRAIEKYFKGDSCACQYPRFIQIASINCSDYKQSFNSRETTILLYKIKDYFTVETLKEGHEVLNQKWTCKKCSSEYKFGWSDFSIHVDREFLKPIEIKIEHIGKEASKPVPLYAGIYGHGAPSRDDFYPVDFETFETYILEK